MATSEDPTGEAVRHLEAERRRHPEDRYPVQHATASFHLGTVHLSAGRPAPATDALRTAVRLFAGMPVERAKALNMLGVAHRTGGSAAAAATAFAEAEAAFGAAGQPLEQAAAAYNLGLVALDAADQEAAVERFRRARQLFAEHGAPAQASAAGRELGAALLTSDRAEEAVEVLVAAVADAERAGDHAALGGAANVLGLAHLALDRAAEAVRAFQTAGGANPRGIRPDGYAMAKANLALAHERLGDAPRARLAARQARDTPGAPPAARAQAVAVIQRLPPADDDLLVVLDDEPQERWTAVAREELIRWADVAPEEQRAGATALVLGHLARRDRAVELAAAWLSVLLELPPPAMERLVDRLVEALHGLDEAGQDRFRAEVSRAMASFHVPQLLRLRDTFDASAARVGHPGSWT